MADNNIFSWIPAVAQLAQLNMQIGQNMERIKKERDEELKREQGFGIVSEYTKQFQGKEYTSEQDMTNDYNKMLTDIFATKNPYAIQSGLQVLPSIMEQKAGLLKQNQARQGIKSYIDLSSTTIQGGKEISDFILNDPKFQSILESNPELGLRTYQDMIKQTEANKGLFTFDPKGNITYGKRQGDITDPNRPFVTTQYQFDGRNLRKNGQIITDFVSEFGEDAPELMKQMEGVMGFKQAQAQLNRTINLGKEEKKVYKDVETDMYTLPMTVKNAEGQVLYTIKSKQPIYRNYDSATGQTIYKAQTEDGVWVDYDTNMGYAKSGGNNTFITPRTVELLGNIQEIYDKEVTSIEQTVSSANGTLTLNIYDPRESPENNLSRLANNVENFLKDNLRPKDKKLVKEKLNNAVREIRKYSNLYTKESQEVSYPVVKTPKPSL